MGPLERVACVLCIMVAIGACASTKLPSVGSVAVESLRTGKSFGLKSLFGLAHTEPTTTERSAPKQIWKIHKYHGIELRPVNAPPAPAQEYGLHAKAHPAETASHPAEVKTESLSFFSNFPKLSVFSLFRHPAPEPSTPYEIYKAPAAAYPAPVEAYKPPVASYSAPVTSYGTPAESYATPSQTLNPPAEAYNKLPETRAPPQGYEIPTPVYVKPVEKVVQTTKTISFPFKKYPKITSETKEPEPIETYNPNGSSSSGLDALEDLDKLAHIAELLPEGVDPSSPVVEKILENVDLDTITEVLEFLNSKNTGSQQIDISALMDLMDFLPSVKVSHPNTDLGSIIRSIPDVSTFGHSGKGHLGKFNPFSKTKHPKLFSLLAVLKGLKAAEIAKLSHILRLGKKHQGPLTGIFGKHGGVGTAAAVVATGKAAKLGLIGSSLAGVKGAITKPFRHVSNKLFPKKKGHQVSIPSLLPVTLGNSLQGKLKSIPEYFSKIVSSGHHEGAIPDLPTLPNFGLNFPKFPQIAIAGGYRLEKNSGGPYVRVSYPQKKMESAKTASDETSHSESSGFSAPLIPTNYNTPSLDASSDSHELLDPRNTPSTHSSSQLTAVYGVPAPVYKAPEVPAPVYEVPEQEYGVPEVSKPAYKVPEAPEPVYKAPVVPHLTYGVPHQTNQLPQAPKQQYETPKEAYEVPQQAYQAQAYQLPQQTYRAPQETYQTPQQTYQIPQQSQQVSQSTQNFLIRVPELQYKVPSALPKTSFQSAQSRRSFEEYGEEDYGYGQENEYEQAEISSGSYRGSVIPIPINHESQETPSYETQQFHNGQYVSMKTGSESVAPKVTETPVNAMAPKIAKSSTQNFAQILQNSNYYKTNSKRQFAGYQNQPYIREEFADTYTSASEPQASVVASPEQSQMKDGQITGETTKLYKVESTRTEKQLDKSSFAAPSAVSGFEPSTASAMTGSGYSRVNFQRSESSPAHNSSRHEHAASSTSDVATEQKKMLPITVAKSLTSSTVSRPIDSKVHTPSESVSIDEKKM